MAEMLYMHAVSCPPSRRWLRTGGYLLRACWEGRGKAARETNSSTDTRAIFILFVTAQQRRIPISQVNGCQNTRAKLHGPPQAESICMRDAKTISAVSYYKVGKHPELKVRYTAPSIHSPAVAPSMHSFDSVDLCSVAPETFPISDPALPHVFIRFYFPSFILSA